MLMKHTDYDNFQSLPFLVSGGPQTLPLAEHHPKGDKNYNGCCQCSNYRGDDAPYAVCETKQVKEYGMSNERGEGCDN